MHLFSSLAAFSGAAGQGSYASANAVLDAWAHHQQVRSMLVPFPGATPCSAHAWSCLRLPNSSSLLKVLTSHRI
jgi:hypothetical protein